MTSIMNARRSQSMAPGPDLLARYLNAYTQARQLSDTERPWGLGDDALDSLWSRLTSAMSDPPKLDRIVAEELTAEDRLKIVETLVPLIFALPLRSYPAELRAERVSARLLLSLRHLDTPLHDTVKTEKTEKLTHEQEVVESVGFLPAALLEPFAAYLRQVLHWTPERHWSVVTISSGGRRRRVRVTLLSKGRGVIVRFIERQSSPTDE
jgi:hypothetical protein